jgi:16S rRNA (guanine966-N2)-methyltransferase
LREKGGKAATTVKNTGKSRGGQWGAQRDGAPPAASRAARSRMLRIIGGTWRGRRLRFPPQEEIRPTPDRVRETLFNWLGPRVPGSRCLDLFAGSGALGLEALSRGAAQVTFVERDAVAVRELRARLTEWRAVGALVEHSDALHFLGNTAQPGKMGQPFDIVFLDPPFASGLLPSVCRLLEDGHWLSANALIYVETDAQAGLPPLSQNWEVTRTKQAGAVGYHLLTRMRGDSGG